MNMHEKSLMFIETQEGGSEAEVGDRRFLARRHLSWRSEVSAVFSSNVFSTGVGRPRSGAFNSKVFSSGVGGLKSEIGLIVDEGLRAGVSECERASSMALLVGAWLEFEDAAEFAVFGHQDVSVGVEGDAVGRGDDTRAPLFGGSAIAVVLVVVHAHFGDDFAF